MKFVLERTVNPAVEPVTLSEAKLHLRGFTSTTDLDNEITQLIVSAREWVEDYTGRALVEQRWRLSLDRRVGNPPGQGYLAIPVPSNGYGWYQGETQDGVTGWLLRKSPVIAITSFVSVDSDGVETAVATADYRLADANTKWPMIAPIPASPFVGDVFRITYRAGYAPSTGSPDPEPDVALVPARYKQAILLHVEAFYDRDKDLMDKLITAAENLLRGERCELSIA